MKYLLLLVVLAGLASCKKDPYASYPGCAQSYIKEALAKSKGTMAISIDAYTYQNKTVYLYNSDCCDQYNGLKDESCTPMFSPSGGLTGKGDGTHPTFFTDAVFIKNVWTDPRP
jgi:hypothetical protein